MSGVKTPLDLDLHSHPLPCTRLAAINGSRSHDEAFLELRSPSAVAVDP